MSNQQPSQPKPQPAQTKTPERTTAQRAIVFDHAEPSKSSSNQHSK